MRSVFRSREREDRGVALKVQHLALDLCKLCQWIHRIVYLEKDTEPTPTEDTFLVSLRITLLSVSHSSLLRSYDTVSEMDELRRERCFHNRCDLFQLFCNT